VLGTKYLIPLTIDLFVFDEGSFIKPLYERTWLLRTFIANYFAYKFEKEKQKDFKFIEFAKEYAKFIKLYKILQIKKSPVSSNIKNVYVIEETVAYIIGTTLIEFIEKYKKELLRFRRKIEDNKEEKDSNLLPIYLKFSKDFWESFFSKL